MVGRESAPASLRTRVERRSKRQAGAGRASSGVALLILAAAAGVVGAGAAQAQTASQITPPTFRPAPRSGSGSGLVFSGQPGLGTPAGAERLNVRLSGVTVEGAPPELAAETRVFEQRLLRGSILASEIFAAARDLEAAFARAGFVLSRAVLPAQTLRNGDRLRLVVVNGFIERVEYRDVPENIRGRIGAIVEPLVGQRGVILGDIERRLLLAGDTPGVALRSSLAPGAQPGGTVLIVETKYRPVTGFFGGDNTLSGALGGFSIGAGIDANSALGFGETIYLRAFGYPGGNDQFGYGSLVGDRPRLRTLSVGAVAPIGIDGLTFNVEGTESRTTPRLANGVQTSSIYDRLSFRLRYPWIRSRTFNFNTEAALDITSEDLRLLVPGASLPLSLDRLRVMRLAADGDLKLDTGGVVAGRGIVSFGIDGLGARSAAQATPLLPLSRLGADDDFKKLEANVSVTQPLAEHLAATFYVRGQTSFGAALPRSEQIGFASFTELSTFDAGTLGGDSGWVVRGELSAPYSFPIGSVPLSVTPYIFGATGQLFLEQPTIFERSRIHVSAVGGGVRLATAIDPYFQQATLTLEFGRRFRDDGLADSNRFTVVGSIRF